MPTAIDIKQDVLYLVSIYPARKDSSKPNLHLQHRHRDKRPYILEAAPAVWGEKLPNGEVYTVETVWHAFSRQQNYSNDDIGAPTEYDIKPIPNHVIAENLIQVWRNQAYKLNQEDDLARPGIMLLPPGQKKPTKENIEEMFEWQDRLAKQWLYDGDSKAAVNKYNEISPVHKMWAKWLGKGEDPWGAAARAQALSRNGVGGTDLSALLSLMQKQQEQIDALTKKLDDQPVKK